MGNNVSIEPKSHSTLRRRSLISVQHSILNHQNNNNDLIISLNQHQQQQQQADPRLSIDNSTRMQSSVFQSGLTAEQFSRLEQESAFSEMTDYSHFSFNAKENNDYIMSTPELNSTPTTLHTSKEMVDYLIKNSSNTFDILTTVFNSSQMKHNPDFQREAYKALELWVQIADDPSAKVCIARCKLCGWGTEKDPKAAFVELKRLATEQDTWESYFFLAQCYYYGITDLDQTIQAVDKKKACTWFKKSMQVPQRYQTSQVVPHFVAQAQVCVAITNLLAGDSVDENIELVKASARAGNKIAEFQLGYLIKLGVTSDTKTTAEYFTLSAQKSYSPAQIQLALILLQEGKTEQGFYWLKKATDLNDPQAYYQLGNIYELGSYGVGQHFELAYTNYYHAVEKYGHHLSEFRLGMNYLIGGLDLPKDTERAFGFIQSAALAGEPGAQYILGIMYREGEVPNRPHKAAHEIAQNKKEAFRWFRKAAAQNLPAAMTQVAFCYEQGHGVAVNHVVANQYYERALCYANLSSTRVAYARFLCSQKRYKEGFEHYLQASGLIGSDSQHPAPPQVISEAKRMVAIFYLDNTKDSDIPYKPKEGFELLTDLVISDPDNGCVHYWVAASYEKGIPNVSWLCRFAASGNSFYFKEGAGYEPIF
ncbi:hypothetical protein G6F35_007526 [Rhizopus arrhizus]|nr:hypothetical protein G6F35_007526 [Rhizopus arrhizus]